MIPLISDTQTKPTRAMRQAMAEAEVGDEQHGEDPTVNRLQARVAELLDKEAALWFPTGTMCNGVSIKVHTRPADAVIADYMCHVIRAEAAGSAVSSGVMIEPIVTERGIFTGPELEEAIARTRTAPVPYGPPARLVCVEQTHNFSGGTVWPVRDLAAIRAVAREHDLAIHMDGARLINASVATGVPPAEYAAEVDSLWVDFTKGLGAPVGAVLAGSAGFIEEARRQKHIFAGAMRQAGIVAAGCLHALDHHVDRLAEDHEHAALLAKGLGDIDGVDVQTPVTNIVFFDAGGLGPSNQEFVAAMASEGVKLGVARGQIRAVTHLDVARADIELAVAAARRVAARFGTSNAP